MRSLLLVLLLTGCSGTISIISTSPNGVDNRIEIDTARRTVVALNGGEITVMTGQVAIDDSTVQALGRNAKEIILVDTSGNLIDQN